MEMRETPAVHKLVMSTGAAYDRTQMDDEIYDGDVLYVLDQELGIIVGFMCSAWPVALYCSTTPGAFHTLTPGSDVSEIEGGRYAATAALAKQWAEPDNVPKCCAAPAHGRHGSQLAN